MTINVRVWQQNVIAILILEDGVHVIAVSVLEDGLNVSWQDEHVIAVSDMNMMNTWLLFLDFYLRLGQEERFLDNVLTSSKYLLQMYPCLRNPET